MPRSSNKRKKLLDSARQLIHQQGFRQTTLADIAENSEVPLGNVYYYFKTKEDIAEAVITERISGMTEMAKNWNRELADPRQRINALLDVIEMNKDSLAEVGCPIGGLCQELNKSSGTLPDKANEILRLQLDWLEQQFTEMGVEDPRVAAMQFSCNLQGIALMANSMKDPQVVKEQVARLRENIATQ